MFRSSHALGSFTPVRVVATPIRLREPANKPVFSKLVKYSVSLVILPVTLFFLSRWYIRGGSYREASLLQPTRHSRRGGAGAYEEHVDILRYV